MKEQPDMQREWQLDVQREILLVSYPLFLQFYHQKVKSDASLQEFVSNQKDEKILKQWLTMAASADSVAEFESIWAEL